MRNKEVRNLLILLLLLAAATSAIGFAMSFAAGILVIATSTALILIFMLFTRRRYRHLAALSVQIDQILHGNDSLQIEDLDEGELSILATEISKMTVKLREQADSLRRDKLYLSESIADIAHQIRTPISSIGILTTLLAQEGVEGARSQGLLREQETLLAHVDWLVTALLKISRIDAGTAIFASQDITLASLIEKALQPFAISLELHGIQIEAEVSGSVRCDPAWTAEAISNVVKNCIEHSSDGSVIKIEATENPIMSQIVISDYGSGINEADLPHVFERFYRGSGADTGNFGVGLALSRMILNEQNGTIQAQNNVPQGASFIIKLYHHQTL